MNDHKLTLYEREHYPLHGLYIDFLDNKLQYRILNNRKKDEALIKAIGKKNDNDLVVVDATAGLGRDAFILYAYDYRVIMFENNPVIALLLQDAISRIDVDQERFSLYHVPSITELSEDELDIDVIYLDPMYPDKNKSSLVKKDMQFLQKIVVEIENNDVILFRQAQQLAKKKVVVKRPNYADHIDYKKPSYMIKSKKHRFDVYVK